MINDVASLALDYTYACNDLDIYEKAKDILLLDSISKMMEEGQVQYAIY